MKVKGAICVLVILFLLVGCSNLKTETFKQLYKKDLNNVSKIEILNGTTGEKKSIIDKTVINKFLDEMKDIKFVPDRDQSDRKGYRYSVTLYDKNGKSFSFTSTEFNGHYYHSDNDVIKAMDNLFHGIL